MPISVDDRNAGRFISGYHIGPLRLRRIVILTCLARRSGTCVERRRKSTMANLDLNAMTHGAVVLNAGYRLAQAGVRRRDFALSASP
jgi:hypothetical protein